MLPGLVPVILLSLAGLDSSSGSSLMKRIRERQSADEAMIAAGGGTDAWTQQVPQQIHDVLLSIDDKLRSLDTFGYTLKLARLDFSLDQLVRRMENIETRLGRLETKFDVRMEKVEEVVVGKDIKEEFSNEHLTRRMETLHEKINSKASYLDARLERLMGKLEGLERDLHSSTDDILERIVRGEERQGIMEADMVKQDKKLDHIDAFLKDELVTTVKMNFEHIKSGLESIDKSLMNVQINVSGTRERILGMVDRINNMSVSKQNSERGRISADLCQLTQDQLENLTIALEKALMIGEARFKELDSDVELYTRKVINGIQELWKTSDELKLDLSNALEQGSKTREMVRQEFQRLHEQIEPLPKLEPKLSDISEDLDKKVFELSTTVDQSFATLLVAQNTFIDSCKRIQEEEMHIYDILQQIVYEMRNRSIADVHRISSELQTQSLQIDKSLSHVLTAVTLTSNITTNAVNDLLEHVKKNGQRVILKAENWEVMESLCNRIPMGEDALTLFEKSASDETIKENEILLKNHSVHKDKEEIKIMYNNESDKAEEASLHSSDYEVDYPLPQTDYR